MPTVAFPLRYRPQAGQVPPISPGVLTPLDDDASPAFDPSMAQLDDNQQPSPLPPPQVPMPKPPRNNDTMAAASLAKLPPLNPDAGSKASFSGLKKVMPPPGQKPAAAPVAPPIGQLDTQVAGAPPATTPASASASASVSQDAQQQPDLSAADKLKALESQKPEMPSNNWAQRLGMAILAATRLAPAANQIMHPKWSAQRAAWEQERADVATQSKIEEQEEASQALAQQRQEKAAQLQEQAQPHHGQVQLDPQFAKENLPWLRPDEKGQYWVDKTVANTLSKPDKEQKPTVVPPGSTVVDENGKVLYTAPAKEEKATGDFEKVFLPAYAAKLGKTVQTLTPDETIKAFSNFKQVDQDPERRAAALASASLAEAVRQMQLSQQPTSDWAHMVADDIINHRLAPDQMSQMIGGFGTAAQTAKRMIYAEAKKIEPNFNFEQASAEYGLVKSPSFQNTIRYMDSVQSSLPRLISSADQLANSGVRSINQLLNMGRNQFQSVDLKRFNTDRLMLADEVAKILQGGGTGNATSDLKLKQAAEIFRADDNPASVRTAVQEIQALIGYRRKNLTRGTYLENTAPAGESGGVTVQLRDGRSATFAKQEDADRFRREHPDKVK